MTHTDSAASPPGIMGCSSVDGPMATESACTRGGGVLVIGAVDGIEFGVDEYAVIGTCIGLDASVAEMCADVGTGSTGSTVCVVVECCVITGSMLLC